MSRRVVLLVAAIALAAVGASLVLLYVNGLSGSAKANESLVRVLTATELVSPGEKAATAQAEGKFALTSVPKSSVVPGAVTSVDNMSDQVALSSIYPGEQILAAKFGTTAASEQTLSIPKGTIGVSVQLSDPARVAGFVTPGSRVAIFVSSPATTSGTTTTQATTRVLVPDAEVIGVGPSTVLSAAAGDKAGASSDEVPKTVLTVALSQWNSDRVLLAASTGGLAFGLLSQGMKMTRDHGVTAKDLQK
jgi:pilus assembly protein CpaB